VTDEQRERLERHVERMLARPEVIAEISKDIEEWLAAGAPGRPAAEVLAPYLKGTA